MLEYVKAEYGYGVLALAIFGGGLLIAVIAAIAIGLLQQGAAYVAVACIPEHIRKVIGETADRVWGAIFTAIILCVAGLALYTCVSDIPGYLRSNLCRPHYSEDCLDRR